MALPSHDQIMKTLGGQKIPTPTIDLPSQPKTSFLKSAVDFGKKLAKNIGKRTEPLGPLNVVAGTAETISDSPKTRAVLGKIFPGAVAVKQSLDQKSVEPVRSFLQNKAFAAYNPRTLPGETIDQKIERVSVPVIGIVGEGANVVKSVASKLAKEASGPAVRNVLKSTFKNMSDEVIERLTPILTKSKKVKEIERALLNELEGAVPAHADVMKALKPTSKADSVTPEAQVPAKVPSIQGTRTAVQAAEESLPATRRASATVPSSIRTVDVPLPESTTKLLQKSSLNPKVGSVASTLRETKTSMLEAFQNSQERVRQLVSRAGVKVDDVSDPYLKSTLFSGRIGTKMEATKQEVKSVLTELKAANVSREELSDYLIARHAPERNAALGDNAAGITTKDAQARLAALETSAKGAQIKAIADKIQEINRRTLDMLQESGVITKELYDTLKTKYKYHVPLNRIMEDTDDIAGALSGRGFDVKSTGIRAAKGSERKVADVMGNVIYNYEQAILRSEKNIVDQATLNFVRKNKDVLGDLFEIVKPKAIGKTFGKDGKPILEKTNDPTILQMFENGQRIWIKINDPHLAVAIRGVGTEKLGRVMSAVAWVTRLYSGLMTRFNPEFFLPNKIRDLQEVAVYLSSQKGIGVGGAARAATRDVGSVSDVISALRGKDTAGARLYKEMKDLGGTTGGMGLSTRKETELNIAKLEKLVNSKTRRIADNLIEYVDNLNTIFEDSTRLSVYKEALARGLSKDRAAFLAKEASINFNRMGTGGPVVNALWMFSNASIQGTMKMLRSLKNPKTLGLVATTVGASVAAVNEWNDKVDPEWREKVSKWDRLNSLPVMLPNIDGEGASYFTIPVSWGIKPIKVMADYAYDASSGQEFDIKTALDDLSASIIAAYNPVGGTDFISAVSPTIIDTPVDIARNVSWTGNKIRPDFDPYAPKDIQYYSSLGDTKTGQAAISISEMLQNKFGIAVSPADLKYAYEQYVGGAGRTVTKTFNTIAGVATGDAPDLDEFPLISRFYRTRTEEEISMNKGTSATTERIKDQLQGQSRDRFKLKNKAEQMYEDLKKLPPAEATARAKELSKSDPLLYAKIKETFQEKKLGLSYTERLMKQLGVENGERAKFVYSEIVKLPKDKRNAYYQDLKSKKIVTGAVEKQLAQMLKRDKIKP
jgi:hypothetical protein